MLASRLHMGRYLSFSEEEIKQFEEIIRSTAHLIIEFSKEGALRMPQIFRMGEY